MTLHPQLLNEMLEVEVDAAVIRLTDRVAEIDLIEAFVYCWLTPRADGGIAIRLDGENYDSEPFRVTVVDRDGIELPSSQWPGQLFHSVHPVLQKAFACVRGAFEYHCHPSHTNESWDAYRMKIRLADLLDHLVSKAGR